MIKYILILSIKFYKLFLSPLLGNHCRFYPTCSNYAIEAIKYHGPMKGGAMAAKRVCRCHPWCKGGVDEVPK